MKIKKHYNAIINLIIPAILINLVTGSVYCWSLLSKAVMDTFACTKFQADISFSLAIFFLGMSGAVFGSTAEKNPKLMYILSTITFILGLVVSGIACYTGILPLLWIGFGCLLGIGCGTSYVANPKSLSVWFRHNKGKGTSIAILSFGFAKVFGTALIQFLLSHFDLFGTFLIMGLTYFVPMMVSTLMFKKIPFNLKDKINTAKIRDIICTKKYAAIWLMFCANITCGLAFIANEAPMLRTFGFGLVSIGLISSLSSVFNSLGRFGFAALSDWKGREFAYFVIFGISVLACILNMSYAPIIFVIALMMINMGYGGGFSALPALITKHYGLTKTSTIHGLTLSGWAMGGIFGPVLANTLSYQTLLFVLAGIYGLSFVIVKRYVKETENQPT